MATNTEKLNAAFAALYEKGTPGRLAKLTTAVVEQLTAEQIEAKYPGETAATLNDNQQAFFVLEYLRTAARNTVQANEQRKARQTQQAAREAARQAAQDAASGF